MTDNLLSELSKASSDEEREWIVMQFSLNNLAPELQEAVWAAAIPHWFDVSFLAALLDKTATETHPIFEQLLTLSFIESFQGRGYNVHERSRSLLLRQLWKTDQPRYRELAQRAADYCVEQDQSDTGWRIEYVYHLLIADPDEGVREYQSTGWEWHDPPNFAYAKVEAMTLVVRELVDANRLSNRALAWTQFWEGLLDYDYSRHPSAKTKFSQIKISPAEDILLTSELAFRLGETLLVLSEHEAARRQYEAALLLHHQNADSKLGEANCLLGLGDIHRNLSEHEAARRQYEAALLLYQEIGSQLGEANCLLGLGDVHLNLSEHEAARQQYEAALLLFQKVGSRQSEANSLRGLGDIHLNLSEYEPARQRYEAAITVYQQVGDRLGEANCLKGLGDIHRNLSEYERARRQYEAALPLFQQIGNRIGEANCIQGLGDIHLRLSEYEQARRQYQAALPLYQQVGDRRGEANCLKGLGDIHRILSEYEQARQQYEAALPFFQRTSDKTGEAVSRLGLIACYRNLGLTVEAKQQIELARESVANDSLYNRACFAALCGEVDEALTLLRSALEKREVNLEWARKDPDFDWIRDDPRFEQLLAEIAAKQR